METSHQLLIVNFVAQTVENETVEIADLQFSLPQEISKEEVLQQLKEQFIEINKLVIKTMDETKKDFIDVIASSFALSMVLNTEQLRVASLLLKTYLSFMTNDIKVQTFYLKAGYAKSDSLEVWLTLPKGLQPRLS